MSKYFQTIVLTREVDDEKDILKDLKDVYNYHWFCTNNVAALDEKDTPRNIRKCKSAGFHFAINDHRKDADLE